jgi:hypothetical protein
MACKYFGDSKIDEIYNIILKSEQLDDLGELMKKLVFAYGRK